MEVFRLSCKLLRGSSDFALTKNIFLVVNAKVGWLEQRRVLNNFSSLLIGQNRIWCISSGTNVASHWQEAFADGTPTEEKLSNKMPLTLSEAPAPSQTTFITDQLHSTGDK